MAGGQSNCDPGRIEQWLEGRLPPDEQRQLEDHLETCTTCRHQLETRAASEDCWKEAAAHLRNDAFDLDAEFAGLCVPVTTNADDGAERVEALRITEYLGPTDDPRMLGRFAGYDIVGVIGWGGMGVVLKGFESALDRYVAIKVLAPHLATSGAARTRFRREARAAAAVLHDNVVAIHHVSEAQGLPYLVMPYLPGDSLQKRLDEQGPLQLQEVLRIGMQIAAGLAAAHTQGLVHRDIKPGNILLDKGVERVTITDFGLARAADDASLTRSGVIAGTPQYMSPEQARGEPLDNRSDLFSLGSVLYAMCTGRPPFRAETTYGILQRISQSHPTPIPQIAAETPDWLCDIIAKLHAKFPCNRFQSAAEVANLLARWLAHIQQPSLFPAPPRTGVRRRRARMLRRFAAAAGVGLAGLCMVVVLLFWSSGRITIRLPNHVGADPTGHTIGAEIALAVQAIPGELVLQEECQRVGERMLQIEREWSQSPSPRDDAGWRLPLLELDRQLTDLGQRIERDLP